MRPAPKGLPKSSSFNYTPERLTLITGSLNPEFKNLVEFRHESWWQDTVYSAMAAAGITFCSVNYPKLPTAVVATTPVAYIRMHGNPRLFYSEYSKETLQLLYKDVLSQPNFNQLFIYFNNTASTAAIINAQQFKEMSHK